MTATTAITARPFTSKGNANRAARNAGLASWTVDGPRDGKFFVVDGATMRAATDQELADDRAAWDAGQAVRDRQVISDALVALGHEAADLETLTTPELEDMLPPPGATETPAAFLVQIGDNDAFVVPSLAEGEGQRLADEEGETVRVRHATTDALLGTYEPAQRDVPPPATDAALEGTQGAAEDLGPTVEGWTALHAARAAQDAPQGAPAAGDLVDAGLGMTGTAEELRAAARLVAKVLGRATTLTLDGLAAETFDPPARRQARAPAAPKASATPKAPKDAPEGKRAVVVAMCCRPEGASPKELFAATEWHGAPWKWLLHNPKGEGLAQRYGYEFRAERTPEGARYYFTKPAAAAAA